jgi:hypothetical protein
MPIHLGCDLVLLERSESRPGRDAGAWCEAIGRHRASALIASPAM